MMTTSAVDDQKTGTTVGRLLLGRIMIREKLRLQVQFLDGLTRIPQCRDVVLYGGAALHGVHLHGRLSDDLDLAMPSGFTSGFLPLLAAHDLALEKRESAIPAYIRPGALGVPLGIGIDLSGQFAPDIHYECRPFGFLAGRTVPVVVPPLADMLAEKLRCVTCRAQAVDYVDLWLGLGRGVETITATFAALQARKSDLIYDPATAWKHLDLIREGWQECLQPLMLRVPDYAEVRGDLEGWLR